MSNGNVKRDTSLDSDLYKAGYIAGLERAAEIIAPISGVPMRPHQSQAEVVAYDTRRNMVLDIEKEINK